MRNVGIRPKRKTNANSDGWDGRFQVLVGMPPIAYHTSRDQTIPQHQRNTFLTAFYCLICTHPRHVQYGYCNDSQVCSTNMTELREHASARTSELLITTVGGPHDGAVVDKLEYGQTLALQCGWVSQPSDEVALLEVVHSSMWLGCCCTIENCF